MSSSIIYKLFDAKETNNIFNMTVVLYSNIDFTVKYIRLKHFFKEIKSLISDKVYGS